MSVFSKVTGFFYRHRNKFLVGGVLISSTILLTRYAQQRLKEWQEKEMVEFMDRTRKQQHFESIGRTCNQTILNLSATLNEAISKSIDTDELISDLRNKPDNKVETWNALKVLLFSKIGCIIYSNVMLIITLRIQLNLIGGYLYKDPTSITTEVQEQYLSLTQNLLNSGIERLSSLIQSKINIILENIDLKKQLRLSDIEALFWSLQTAIATEASNPIDKFKEYIIPNDLMDNGDLYNILVRDTSDLLESDDVKALTGQCINRGFILLGDELSEFYNPNGAKIKELTSSTNSDIPVNVFDVKKPLAKLLPIMNGLVTKTSFPDKLAQQLIINEKLQLLGANVYESLL